MTRKRVIRYPFSYRSLPTRHLTRIYGILLILGLNWKNCFTFELTLTDCQYEFLDFWLGKLFFQQKICPSSEPLTTNCPQGEKVPPITKFSELEKPLKREISEFDPREYMRMRESAELIRTRSSRQSIPETYLYKRPHFLELFGVIINH